MVLIYRANSAKNKAQHIEQILERVQAIQLLMRLSHDMKILPRRHYAALSEMTEDLAKLYVVKLDTEHMYCCVSVREAGALLPANPNFCIARLSILGLGFVRSYTPMRTMLVGNS